MVDPRGAQSVKFAVRRFFLRFYGTRDTLEVLVGVHSSIYGNSLGKFHQRKTHLERAVNLDRVE